MFKRKKKEVKKDPSKPPVIAIPRSSYMSYDRKTSTKHEEVYYSMTKDLELENKTENFSENFAPKIEENEENGFTVVDFADILEDKLLEEADWIDLINHFFERNKKIT